MADTALQFYRSERGRDQAVYKGYGYGLDTVTQRGAKRLWRCHVKGCHGRLHTIGYTVVYSTAHTHKPLKGLKERVSLWQQTPMEDTVPVNRLTENIQQPSSSLNTVKIRADLLYSSVSQAPSDKWPTLVQILQEMMDRVVQHVTGGSISCVQIIPVDSNSFTDQLLTLHDIVSNTVPEAPYNVVDKVRPCSVVVNKLNNTDLLNLSIEQGLSVTDIKQEVMDGDEEDTAESTAEECYTEPLTDLKKEQNEEYVPETSKGDVVRKRSASRQISHEDEEYDVDYIDDGDDDAVLEDSDGADGETLDDTTWPAKRARRVSAPLKEASSGDDDKDNDISDEEWKPKTRARKAKNPRRRTPSTQQIASPVSSDEEDETSKSENKFTPRRNRFLVAEQYENYDLSATFEDAVQNKCFLCPTDKITKVNSLEAFIEHLTDANHLEYKRVVIRVLRCPICRVELRNRASERDGPEKIQILRLAGKVLQHMEYSHGFETEGAFLCQYQCDKCVYTTYGVGNFVEHVIHTHKGEANPVESELPVSRTSSVVSLEKYETYNVNAPFSEGVNAICPFCPLDTAYKAETLIDFVSHLKEQKHILDVDEASYSLTCVECQLEIKSTGHLHKGTDENRVLRLVGNAVNHMTTNHAYNPEEGFIPKYQCDGCTTNTYDCRQFIDHCVKVHGAKEELLEKRGMRDRITDEQLKAYLPSNFDKLFEESVDTQCPFCPDESKYKSHSLSDFLKHVRDAEHLFHGEGALYSMSCPSCDKVHKCRIYHMSDMQVLRVVGRVIQHQMGKHDLKVSNLFIPQYHCDQCSHAAYSYMDFRDHIRRLHYKHTQGSSAEEEEAPVEEEKSDEEGHGGFSKFPERHISMSRPFAKEIDTSCPFCKPGNVYKPKTMADFIQHVYKAEHLSVDRSYRYIQCNHCDEKIKSRVFINFGKKSTQTLRVIGKAAHHMYVAHGTRFEEGFLPVYECDKCVFNSYSGEQLTDHTRALHKKSGGKPRRFKLPNEVVNREVKKRGKKVQQDRGEECVMVKAKTDMCNLHLANDIFENTQKTLLSFDETLNPELGAVCPLCDDQVTFSTLKDFADHSTAKHIQADMSFVTLDCPDCQTTLACKKYKRDEPMTLALCVIGKWADHRSKQHSWSVPNFIPKFRCQCCQDFTTYSPRACHGHIHTPGKCRKNPGDKRKLTQPCPCCGKMVSQRSFNSHVQVCSKPDSERKRTSCPICGKMFLDELAYHKSNLKHHIDIVHSDYFPHLCSICSTQFKRRNDLNRHMFMVHDINISNNVPLYCDKCDYKTLMSSHLKRHYSKHQEDASVTCHYCGKQYKTEHHLKRHIEDVHDKGTGKQYKCPQCSYVAKSKRYLQKHVRWHYYGKIGAGHWCTICNYNARFPSVLKFHMKNVHKINMDEPGAEKQAAYKSVMLKRKYKNMKLPGEMGDDLFDGSISGKVAAIIGESIDREDPGGMSSDDGESGEAAGPLHENSSSMVAETSVTAALETAASEALYRSSCAEQPAFTSTGPTLPTNSGLQLSAQSLSDMSPGAQHTHSNAHGNPHHHHHHHGHGGEAGIQNMIPAHRSIMGPMPPGSVLTNPSQQGNEYLYNPQMFPGFLSSQGLPPQYY